MTSIILIGHMPASPQYGRRCRAVCRRRRIAVTIQGAEGAEGRKSTTAQAAFATVTGRLKATTGSLT